MDNMTYRRFLTYLKSYKFRYNWYLTDSGQLRCTLKRGTKIRCPVTVLASIIEPKAAKKVCLWEALETGIDVLKMSPEIVKKLIYAADNVEGCCPRTRRQLLLATGFEKCSLS